MSDTEFNKLLISEIESLKTDMRQNFSELRGDIKNINTELTNKTDSCNDKFLSSKTFWKFAAIILTLVAGSYSYTTLLFHNLP